MRVEYPVRIEWRGFHFQVYDKANRLWFQGISETGDTNFMSELGKLLTQMVDGVNGILTTHEIGIPMTHPTSATVESNGNREKKPFDRAAHMREVQKKRWEKK